MVLLFEKESSIEIQGTKGAILIDLQNAKVVVNTLDETKYYLLHETEEEDKDRRRIYKNSETDGGIVHGKPTETPPKWFHSIMIKEMDYFHSLMKGQNSDSEYEALTDGTAARNSIATANALTLSLQEDRKVSVKEVIESPGGT